MRIARIETFATKGGLTTYHFLKITSDTGLSGWSEFGDGAPNLGGVKQLILRMGELVHGKDPRAVGRLSADLYAATRMAAGGPFAHAIAAIQNACLDLKAKDLNVPVYELLGGALRDRVPVYWSHCGSYRTRGSALAHEFGLEPITSLDGITQLGAEVAAKGFKALKTNLLRFGADGPGMHKPGFAPVGAGPELNATPDLIDDVVKLMAAFREGAGPHVDLMLDTNFNFRADGVTRLARALEPFALKWLEVDLHDPGTLAQLRNSTATPIASLETVLGIRALAPYMAVRAVDVATIDVMWNGLFEAAAMARLAEAHEISIAPHNYPGPLAFIMGAHLAMIAPNFTIMELDIDGPPWRDTLLTEAPVIADGHFTVPTGAGWGCGLDETMLELYRIAA
jgi:L-alanine-DL-glutamate epimerase-like enolase superfamily enzyme